MADRRDRADDLRRAAARWAGDGVVDRAEAAARAVVRRAPAAAQEAATRLIDSTVRTVRGEPALTARLTRVEQRFAALAASGRVRRADHDELRRELGRAHEDLGRVAAGLPAAQAAALRARLEADEAAFALLPDPRAPRGGGVPGGVQAAGLTGAGAVAWAGMQLPPPLSLVVEGSLVAAGAAAVGWQTVRERRAGRTRREAIADAARVAAAAPPVLGEVPVAELSQHVHDLAQRARRSRRLDAVTTDLLGSVEQRLDRLLARVAAGRVDADLEHLAEATATRYLPDTLEPFLALADPGTDVGGRTAAQELTQQLRALDRALAEADDRPDTERPETRMWLQGEFLRSKFGPGED